jgi:hypothetical protein
MRGIATQGAQWNGVAYRVRPHQVSIPSSKRKDFFVGGGAAPTGGQKFEDECAKMPFAIFLDRRNRPSLLGLRDVIARGLCTRLQVTLEEYSADCRASAWH